MYMIKYEELTSHQAHKNNITKISFIYLRIEITLAAMGEVNAC
jgi:hypothetical protein